MPPTLPLTDNIVFVAIPAVTLAAPGNGNVAWTTLDVSPYVPPGFRLAVLRISVGGCTSSASFVNNSIDVRRDSNAQLAATVGCKLATSVANSICGGNQNTVYVPLTAARTFDYQKTDGMNSSSGASVELIGYL